MSEVATLSHTSILDNTIHSLGYTSLESFAREQVKNILNQKIAYYQSRIELYESKYGMNYIQFCEKFDEIKNHTMFEKEDDSMNWEVAIDLVKIYQLDVNKLNA